MRRALLAAMALAAGCASSAAPDRPGPSPAPTAALSASAAPLAAPAAGPQKGRLPSEPGRFAPAFVAIEGTSPVKGADLADVEGCGKCHAESLAQWRESAHALASFNNPIYRTAIDRLRKDIGTAPSRFCAGCHDLALLVDGAMDAEVAPADKRAHVGVSCMICHGISRASIDGNASFALDGSPVPIPVEGDEESVRRHKARVGTSTLRSFELCASCHKTFLGPTTGNPAHLTGQDESSAWTRSVYAGSHASRIDEPVEQRSCRDCHMPREAALLGDAAAARDGAIASHRFLGGHTYLAALRRDREQARHTADFLRGAASVDVAAVVREDGSRSMPADGAPIRAGERVLFDVVVRNQKVGHRFPGGTLDAQDAWLELEVRDARGKLLAEAGTQHAATGADPTAHVLRAMQADEHGKPLLSRETHKFRAVVFNHTLAPRDAEVIQYSFEAPSGLEPSQVPLRVTARLRHRSRDLTLQEASCADARTARGSAFLEASRKLTGTQLSPCVPQPITDIAEAEASIGGPGPQSPRPVFERLHEHGLGMLHAVQERLDEARPGFERALAAAPGARERAMALWGLGAVAARQGRTDEAFRWLAEAEQAMPGEPAISRARGEALAQVWRWSEAAAPLRLAAAGAPLDDSGWGALALALGSAGDDAAALAAATTGLGLQPRDADLLRVQALSLSALRSPDAAAARDAYLACRSPDDAPRVKALCSRDVPGCALERNPVHAHEMRPR